MTDIDLDKLATLAQISLSEAERGAAEADLRAIVDMIDDMRGAPTDDVRPMSHPLDLSQRLRADEVTDTVEREVLQALAPEAEAGLYLVPQVID